MAVLRTRQRSRRPGTCYKLARMMNELDVLRLVSERFERAAIPFMLTGSFALAYYATPRMTRDLDIVVALCERDVTRLVAMFAADFYLDAEDAAAAIRGQRLFNLMHLQTGIKVDLIVRKDDDYRQTEFSRRQPIEMNAVHTWITSREDLILSKLVWSRASASELQRRDVRALLGEPVDEQYLAKWAARLGVDDLLKEIGR